jgi:hypothetical protein
LGLGIHYRKLKMTTTQKPSLRTLKLKNGSHTSIAKGVCAMEAVAWLAGEEHSDRPQCACPVIASFVRGLNDRMPDDATRTKYLRPVLKSIVGTRSTREIEIKRAYIAADFGCREAAPMALDARGRKEDAAKLRSLDPIVDKASAKRAQAAAYAAFAAYAASAAYAAASADSADSAAAYAADCADCAASAAASAASADSAAASAAAFAYSADSASAASAAASAAAAAYSADSAASAAAVWLAAVACLKHMIAAARRRPGTDDVPRG